MRGRIKDAVLASGNLAFSSSNAPGQYRDKQFEYFSAESKRFIQEYAKYASNYVECRVQGLFEDRPFEWETRQFRFADIIRPHASLTRRIDNYKLVLCDDADVEYLRPGAKIEAMGSTWLVTNPINVSGGDGSGIVERCNAAWNYLDYYGNVKTEPLVIENVRANASDSDAQSTLYITKGYYQATCQCNAHTAQIDTNTRLILGSKAYRVTGLGDFFTEFTGDYDTVRLLDFTLRYEEPNREIDDLKRHVAGGKQFSWEIFVRGNPALAPGATAKFTAESVRNGVPPEAWRPVTYFWDCLDESVAAADVHGVVTGIAPGSTVLRCRLAENPEIFTDTEITVTEEAGADGVRFLEPPPETLRAFEEAEFSAAVFRGGVKLPAAPEWSFGGAAAGSWAATADGETAAVRCFGYSAAPLTVTATYGGSSVSAEIALEGI